MQCFWFMAWQCCPSVAADWNDFFPAWQEWKRRWWGGMGWDTAAARAAILTSSNLLTVINLMLKTFHGDEMPIFWSPKVILLHYFLPQYQVKTSDYSVSVSRSSHYERVYLSVGQVHSNVRLCPKEIKTDVLWHLPENQSKLVIHQAPKFQARSAHWFHHLKAQGQTDPQATSSSLLQRSKCRHLKRTKVRSALDVEKMWNRSATFNHVKALSSVGFLVT